MEHYDPLRLLYVFKCCSSAEFCAMFNRVKSKKLHKLAILLLVKFLRSEFLVPHYIQGAARIIMLIMKKNIPTISTFVKIKIS